VILQSGKISLEVKAANVNALKGEIQAFRNKWDSFLSEASLIAQEMDIPPRFKGEVSRERKRLPGETSEETKQKDSAGATFRNRVFHRH
jgi:exoribonuclease R